MFNVKIAKTEQKFKMIIFLVQNHFCFFRFLFILFLFLKYNEINSFMNKKIIYVPIMYCDFDSCAYTVVHNKPSKTNGANLSQLVTYSDTGDNPCSYGVSFGVKKL